MKRPNCVEVLQQFFQEYGDQPDVQLIGGVGSANLEDERSHIDSANNTLVAPSDFTLPTVRPNGTKRDVDVLVLSTDRQRIQTIQDDLEAIVDNQLDVSVFGIRPAEKLMTSKRNPLGKRALLTFLSDRYENSEGNELVKALFPFAVTINEESLQPWQLEVGSEVVNIPHPGISVINYTNRSISGVRAKDSDKIQAVTHRLRHDAPEVIDWIIDGPGSSQLELSRLIHSAGVGMEPLQAILPEVAAVNESFAEHEAFMLKDHSPKDHQRALGIFAFKARGLRTFESSETIRKIWQQAFERRVAAGIVENS